MAFDSRAERINEIKRDLATVREAIRDTVAGGQSVSVTGGVAVTRVPLAELRKQEATLQRQLVAIQGGAMRTAPDFSEC